MRRIELNESYNLLFKMNEREKYENFKLIGFSIILVSLFNLNFVQFRLRVFGKACWHSYRQFQTAITTH
jgi:hypothetical protein